MAFNTSSSVLVGVNEPAMKSNCPTLLEGASTMLLVISIFSTELGTIRATGVLKDDTAMPVSMSMASSHTTTVPMMKASSAAQKFLKKLFIALVIYG